MQIQSVSGLGLEAKAASAAASKQTDANFADIFNDALNNAKETDAQDKLGTLELLAGEDAGLHTTMIESQKAELALNLAIQIRNKVIDAYNEVMRMQL